VLRVYTLTLHTTTNSTYTTKAVLKKRLEFLLYCYTITRRPLTLKTFSAVPTHVMNICAMSHWKPSTKCTDHAKYVLTDGRHTLKHNASYRLLLAVEALQRTTLLLVTECI